MIPTIEWQNNHVRMIDQRKLPCKLEWCTCRGYKDVIRAIETMVIRGAPAIGVAAAYGVVAAVRERLELVAVPEGNRPCRAARAKLVQDQFHPVQRPDHLVEDVDAKRRRRAAGQQRVDQDGDGEDRPEERREVAQGVVDPRVIPGEGAGEREVEDDEKDGHSPREVGA